MHAHRRAERSGNPAEHGSRSLAATTVCLSVKLACRVCQTCLVDAGASLTSFQGATGALVRPRGWPGVPWGRGGAQ